MTLAGGAATAAPARLQRGSDCEGHLRVQRLSGAPGAAAIVRGTRGLQRFARDVVASSSSCRIVAVSSPHRRRRVVVSRLGAARVAMFGPCRCVVAVSSPLVAVAVVVRVVFVARRRRRRLYPHPRPSPPVLVVALSCVRLCPTAILTPRPSPPVLVVAQSCHPPPPLSSPLSSPESSPLSSPPTTTSPPIPSTST